MARRRRATLPNPKLQASRRESAKRRSSVTSRNPTARRASRELTERRERTRVTTRNPTADRASREIRTRSLSDTADRAMTSSTSDGVRQVRISDGDATIVTRGVSTSRGVFVPVSAQRLDVSGQQGEFVDIDLISDEQAQSAARQEKAQLDRTSEEVRRIRNPTAQESLETGSQRVRRNVQEARLGELEREARQRSRSELELREQILSQSARVEGITQSDLNIVQSRAQGKLETVVTQEQERIGAFNFSTDPEQRTTTRKVLEGTGMQLPSRFKGVSGFISSAPTFGTATARTLVEFPAQVGQTGFALSTSEGREQLFGGFRGIAPKIAKGERTVLTDIKEDIGFDVATGGGQLGTDIAVVGLPLAKGGIGKLSTPKFKTTPFVFGGDIEVLKVFQPRTTSGTTFRTTRGKAVGTTKRIGQTAKPVKIDVKGVTIEGQDRTGRLIGQASAQVDKKTIKIPLTGTITDTAEGTRIIKGTLRPAKGKPVEFAEVIQPKGEPTVVKFADKVQFTELVEETGTAKVFQTRTVQPQSLSQVFVSVSKTGKKGTPQLGETLVKSGTPTLTELTLEQGGRTQIVPLKIVRLDKQVSRQSPFGEFPKADDSLFLKSQGTQLLEGFTLTKPPKKTVAPLRAPFPQRQISILQSPTKVSDAAPRSLPVVPQSASFSDSLSKAFTQSLSSSRVGTLPKLGLVSGVVSGLRSGSDLAFSSTPKVKPLSLSGLGQGVSSSLGVGQRSKVVPSVVTVPDSSLSIRPTSKTGLRSLLRVDPVPARPSTGRGGFSVPLPPVVPPPVVGLPFVIGLPEGRKKKKRAKGKKRGFTIARSFTAATFGIREPKVKRLRGGQFSGLELRGF